MIENEHAANLREIAPTLGFFQALAVVGARKEITKLQAKVDWFMAREERTLASLGPLEESRRKVFHDQMAELDENKAS